MTSVAPRIAGNERSLQQRYYIPKKANFDEFSNLKIKEIQHNISSRPGEKSQLYLPKEIFFRYLNDKAALRC
jgi:IS30 family transposase